MVVSLGLGVCDAWISSDSNPFQVRCARTRIPFISFQSYRRRHDARARFKRTSEVGTEITQARIHIPILFRVRIPVGVQGKGIYFPIPLDVTFPFTRASSTLLYKIIPRVTQLRATQNQMYPIHPRKLVHRDQRHCCLSTSARWVHVHVPAQQSLHSCTACFLVF
jgi:hypothetical protein